MKILIVVPKNSEKARVKVQKIAATPHQIRGQSADVVIVVDSKRIKAELLKAISYITPTNNYYSIFFVKSDTK